MAGRRSGFFVQFALPELWLNPEKVQPKNPDLRFCSVRPVTTLGVESLLAHA